MINLFEREKIKNIILKKSINYRKIHDKYIYMLLQILKDSNQHDKLFEREKKKRKIEN